MTKDKSGVTLVSLIVTIIVMLIIFAVTISTGTILLDNSKKTKIETNLYMVKARAEVLSEQYIFDKNPDSLIYFTHLAAKSINPTGLNNMDHGFETIKSGVKITLTDNSSFSNNVKKIFPSHFSSTTTEYLYVKWGWYECLSQGVYKTDNREVIDKDAIVDLDKNYIIVEYNLNNGDVDVALAEGYKFGGETKYRLDDILEMDVDGE